MIKIKQKGDFKRACRYLSNEPKKLNNVDLDGYAMRAIRALRDATPRDTGLTAESWDYDISKTKNLVTISFYNKNIQNGIPIAILLQYGHATKNGGWVEGIDYINPSLRPVFNELANDMWEEVTKS